MQPLAMTPSPDLFYTADFRDLNRAQLPILLHLKGTVVGASSEKLTAKGVDQLRFVLMDGNRRSVQCLAHDISFPKEILSEGTEVAIFYAQVQAGIRGNGGSIWLYNTSYVLTLGKTFLPGIPIEEVDLRGKA